MRILLALSLVIVMGNSLYAACAHPPKDGVYSTTNGTLLGGRASDAWCSGAGPGQVGNAESAMSWDGVNLGAQWKVWGMAIDPNGAHETGRFFDASGTGWIDYVTTYTGGQFWLSGSHVWGNGSTDYTGALTYYNVSARVSYVRSQAVGVTSNVFFTGSFDGCTGCSIEYAISNAILVWQTGYPAAMPASYPPFLCGAVSGELFNACCATAKIFCNPISTEASTWGEIKSLYR